jgi:hypothetical protein
MRCRGRDALDLVRVGIVVYRGARVHTLRLVGENAWNGTYVINGRIN